MTWHWSQRRKQIAAIAFVSIVVSALVGFTLLEPLWEYYSPPFPIERVFPAITAPVDGPFYLENAELGFRWESTNYLSLWFHPFLSIFISLLPNTIPSNYWFWLVGLISAFGSILLGYKLADFYYPSKLLSPKLIPFIIFIPGGLSIATGNPELPTLFFSSLLVLSVLVMQSPLAILITGVLAILTKPNALYVIPMLSIYCLYGLIKKEKRLIINSAIGILAILTGWLAWIAIVDTKTGTVGSYWNIRSMAQSFVAGSPRKFLIELANSFIYTGNIRDQIRYATAILIPLVNLWLIGMVPFKREVDRFALSAANVSMFLVAFLLGNPNKIIVYATTIPGFIYIGLRIFENILDRDWIKIPVNRFVVAPIFALYCFGILVVYVLGTPLGWYY